MPEVVRSFELMPLPALNDRERRILEAVIQSYVETAEPTGSRSLARRFGFGVSPATIRKVPSAGCAFAVAAVPLRRWQRLQWQ